MTRDARNAGATADEGSSVRRSEIRVLIADDHTVVRDGLVAMLGKWTDVTVVAQAENGREAVEQWRHHRPDVTLLDLRMPVLDGAEAIEQIRAMNALDNNQNSRPLSARVAPLFERKPHDAPSIFRPENMLREARRQKSLNSAAVPAICVIDPDGDIVTYVRRACAASPSRRS